MDTAKLYHHDSAQDSRPERAAPGALADGLLGRAPMTHVTHVDSPVGLTRAVQAWLQSL